jgi:hypothetical protein
VIAWFLAGMVLARFVPGKEPATGS